MNKKEMLIEMIETCETMLEDKRSDIDNCEITGEDYQFWIDRMKQVTKILGGE